MSDIGHRIKNCCLCEERFAATHTAHAPKPVVWFAPEAKILIAGQAPGQRVHLSGRPFSDPSGDRLRDWMGLEPTRFYDKKRIAIVPMAFCFPGYNAKGSDLPPPAVCASTWRDEVMRELGNIRLTLVIGAYAMKYHMGWTGRVAEAVSLGRDTNGAIFALPHPSWRNTGWLKKNPWFESDVLPHLRRRVKEVLDG
jgi:uracil-DNA glycosylase